jgi:hypothetical protein
MEMNCSLKKGTVRWLSAYLVVPFVRYHCQSSGLELMIGLITIVFWLGMPSGLLKRRLSGLQHEFPTIIMDRRKYCLLRIC